MIKSKFFTEEEFNNCSPACSLQDMQQKAIDTFDLAREIAGIPFVPTSAYRSSKWDKSKGRSGTGAHTIGCAMDFKVTNSRERMLIVDALLKAGVNRIGVAKNFVHADVSEKHSKNVLWTY